VSQLVQIGWLDALRATRLGGLLLGHGFQTADLVAYAVGTLVALTADRFGLTHERVQNGLNRTYSLVRGLTAA